MGLMYYLGYIPVSSVRSENTQFTELEVLEKCKREHTLYPGPGKLFPLLSPNNQYYIDLVHASLRRAEVLKLYRAETNKLIGTHSYFKLAIYCWAEDSSGIYVADYVPGSGTDFLFSTSGRTGPVKKLLVP